MDPAKISSLSSRSTTAATRPRRTASSMLISRPTDRRPNGAAKCVELIASSNGVLPLSKPSTSDEGGDEEGNNGSDGGGGDDDNDDDEEDSNDDGSAEEEDDEETTCSSPGNGESDAAIWEDKAEEGEDTEGGGGEG
mmetsp:Transcript_19309/g.31463  ORF Transcript_19309/g.31463 Transcript_19309/m.31463 type:complete len:137 (+) Transcript_19309:598-1008(+)